MTTPELKAIGERHEIGSYTFTPEDIIRFARQFDPQRFHLSDEEAAKTHFGRLCASGWHTASVWMKLMIAYRARVAERARAAGETVAQLGPSPGFEDLKWIRPVFAGDTVTYYTTAVKARPSRSMPGWGILFTENEGVNQHGEPVFSFKGRVFVKMEKDREAAS
ncbi:dehydratase [Stappia sp. GBMRC 2046]|uniref:Dehydratase n=1 Tax=Stappia sediminis TaxID=2692190 RepID=A0A7X3LQP8_9HYPH|nr:MaoC family dehydratase [Stappia sediminis]MXN63342.1 dehydratase [Stappia sediminis]